MKHDLHSYGFGIYSIPYGVFLLGPGFAVADSQDDKDGFYVECCNLELAEEELREHIEDCRAMDSLENFHARDYQGA